MNRKINLWVGLIFVSIFFSCTNNSKHITNKKDYTNYLITGENEHYNKEVEELNFWIKKFEQNQNQHPYLVQIANAQTQLFQSTAKIEYLKSAETSLNTANEKTNFNTASYLRSLAHNLISQHRFREALNVLQKAEQNGEKRMATQKMLFDVYLELGDDDLAEAYLNKFKNLSDFDYLIRLAKWSDHQGNLENAITYFEMAKRIAESAKNKNQLQWIYSNLGDVYGHANRISDSYDHYLKALELNPDDAYSLKGIAWIIYSHEKNPKEAIRILDRVTEMNASPDYFLLKAEIAEFMNDSLAKEKNLNRYLQLVTNKNYGQMYNKHNILLATDEFDNATNALEKAQQEIKLRATPQSYDLLAWSYYVNGDVKKALTIVEEKVVNKTFEPEVQYHIAEIYKANGLGKDAKKLKRELLESAYELGPLLIAKIKLL